MRLLLLCLFALLFGGCASPPEPALYAPAPLPQLSGVVKGHLDISGEVVLVGDVRIPAGSSLRLAPGTLVWVRPAESTKIAPEYLSSLTEILVQGNFLIAGNSQRPVRFLPLKPLDPVAADMPLWAGIEFLSGASGTLSGFEMQRADVGVLVQQADVTVSGGRLTGCRHGLVLQDDARLSAERLTVEKGEVGLFCAGNGVLSIADSSFSQQDEEGLYFARQCRARMRQVVSRKNGVGLVAAGDFWPGLTILDNHLSHIQLQGGAQ